MSEKTVARAIARARKFTARNARDYSDSVLVTIGRRDYRVFGNGDVQVYYWRNVPSLGIERRTKRAIGRYTAPAYAARAAAKPLIMQRG